MEWERFNFKKNRFIIKTALWFLPRLLLALESIGDVKCNLETVIFYPQNNYHSSPSLKVYGIMNKKHPSYSSIVLIFVPESLVAITNTSLSPPYKEQARGFFII